MKPQKFNKLNTDETQQEVSASRISVLKEEIKVGKKSVEKARVKLSKKVKQHLEYFEIPVSEENIVVKRIEKNEMITDIPVGVRYEGDVMIIPVIKEVAIVEKRLMLVEEIHITKSTVEKIATREVPVRTEEVEVTRTETILPDASSKDI